MKAKKKLFLNYRITLVVLMFLSFLSCQKNRTKTWVLESPNKKIKITLLQNSDSIISLNYKVDLDSMGKNIEIVKRSSLGIRTKNFDLCKQLVFTGIEKNNEINEEYVMLSGKRKLNVNSAKEIILVFKNKENDTLQLEFRAYNEGFAFRYQIKTKLNDSIIVTEEITSFGIPQNTKVWMQPNDTLAHWCMGYEIPYKLAIPAGSVSPKTTGWLFPGLFQLQSGAWLLLSEANVGKEYSATQLRPNPNDGVYQIQLPNDFEGWFSGSPNPSSVTSMELPWRFMIVGNSLKTIVESNFVHHLSDKSKIENISWIKHGISSWSWWSDPYSPFYYDRLKKFVDFSAQMGWQYSLVDADWNRMEGGTMEQLAKYAQTKGIGLILWYNSGGDNNVVRYSIELGDQYLEKLKSKSIPQGIITDLRKSKVKQYFEDAAFLPELEKLIGKEAYKQYKDTILSTLRLQNAGPHDLMDKRDVRRKELERISKLGVKGVKVDFWGSDKQNIIQRYIELCEDAALYQLFVNTHGCTIPRGWTKTYPNLLSMEGVMGAEMYGSPDWAELALIQNTVYPFIRNVVGPMDYTPVAFSVKNPDAPHLTTYAHELALTVVFESGILHIADKPEAILAQPTQVQTFLKTVPVVWDNTWFVDGFPADFTIIARKSKDTYYVAGINGKNEARKFSFRTTFLENTNYSCEIIKDGKQADKFSFETTTANNSTKFDIDVLSAGGFVMVLRKK